jgi:integrase
MRRCELCGLEWRDIDFEQETIHIRRNRQRSQDKQEIVVMPTKNRKARFVKIFAELDEKLRAYRNYYERLQREDPEFDDRGIIYCDHMGKPRNPDFVNTLLKRYLAESGCRIVSGHKLRHGWITTLLHKYEVPLDIVSKMAGHSSTEITTQVYTHYHPKDEIDKLKNVYARKTRFESEVDWDKLAE